MKEETQPDVLYLAAEVAPFSKAGGVAMVAGELPPELKRQGVNIEILAPYYGEVDPKHNLREVGSYDMEFNGKRERVQLYEGELDGVRVNFIKNETYFGTKQIYMYSTVPFEDDARRFSFLSQACLHVIKSKNPKIVHVNDWQFGYLLGLMKLDGVGAKTLSTMHNLSYQGNMWIPKAAETSSVIRTLIENPATYDLFQDPRRDWNSVNPFRLALELSDVVNAVSPTYAKEILQPEDHERYFEGGKGLDGIIRRLNEQGRLTGILNGYSYRTEPTDDNFRKILVQKRDAKNQISSAFKSPENLLLGFVGRAVEQKLKLLMENYDGKPVMQHLLEMPGINFVFLGTGDQEYERFLHQCHNEVNCISTVDFDRKRAETINLGSDVCLMPSIHEPCGITQLESMAGATPPLVRLTGGLADTVVPYNLDGASGFGFNGNSREEVLRGLINAVAIAKKVHEQNSGEFNQIALNAFRSRFTWSDSARRYIDEIYMPLLKKADN